MEKPGLKGPERFSKYTRKEIHDMLDPDSAFYYYCGKWGLNGVISVGQNKKDFVFLVRIGKASAYHGKSQRLTEDGTVFWSAPYSASRSSTLLKKLLAHDHSRNSVFLFVCRDGETDGAGDRVYSYIGTLKDPVATDGEELPVTVKWKVENWNKTGIPGGVLAEP